MADQFLSTSEIAKIHPEATPQLLQKWRRKCVWLPDCRPIRFNGAGKSITHSLNDVQDAFLHRRVDPLDYMFEDARGRWIWLQLLIQDVRRKLKWREPVYNIATESVRKWAVDGCPALGGSKLEIRRVHSWPIGQAGTFRDYVRTQDLDKVIAFKGSTFDAAAYPGWIQYSEATNYLSPPTLIGYSDSGYRNRPPGKPHPILKRHIKTKIIRTANNGQIVPMVLFWRADLEKLTNIEDRRNYAGWKQASDDYNLAGGNLDTAVKAGNVRTKTFPVGPRQGARGSTVTCYFIPDLQKLMERLNPATQQDTLGINPDTVRKIDATHAIVTTRLPSMDGKLDEIAVKRVQTHSTSTRKRGKPPATPAAIKADATLFKNFQASGLEDSEFDREKGYEVGTTRLAVKRHRGRLARGTIK